MALSEYIKALLPSYETASLKDNLHSNVRELTEQILPAYENAIELFNEAPMKDKDVQEMSKLFIEKLKVSGLEHGSIKDVNMVEFIREVMRNIITLEGYLKERIDSDCGRKIVTDGMTFSNQFLLQLLESIDFFNRYSKVLINYITHKEFAQVENSRQKVMAIGPGDEEFLQVRMLSFTIVCRILGTPLSKLRADYSETPAIAIDSENIGELRAVFGNRIDPVGFSNVPFPLSLIYYSRMAIANSQMDKYDDTVATAKAVELRIMLYKKKLATGEGDAAIEDLLDLQEKRLMELRRKQERAEKKHGLK
tara:strand:+ start:1722 stop:2645 length:924 start_codon:yes stop_codon:yes gene_type:complete